MLLLIVGLVLFLGIHSVSIVAEPWRNRMAAQYGHGWRAAYALLALLGFALIVIGYGQARLMPVVLYVPPAWTKHLMYLLMLPVFPLLLAAYMPGRIKSTLKHPMLVATKLWALAHLLANGMLADVLLFGGFLAWAVFDRISFKRRIPRPIHTAPARPYNDVLAIVVGLALYMVFMFWAHLALIGVSPL